MAPEHLADDVVLSSLERRRWKQLQRRLEPDDSGASSARRTFRIIAVAVVLALLVAGAVLGGSAGVVAVLVYVDVSLTLWGLHRVLWRSAPAAGPGAF